MINYREVKEAYDRGYYLGEVATEFKRIKLYCEDLDIAEILVDRFIERAKENHNAVSLYYVYEATLKFDKACREELSWFGWTTDDLFNEIRITRCNKSNGIYKITFPPIRHFGTSLDGFEIRKKEQS